jgi:uncharacterized protein (TIGR04255 family)
MPAPLPRYEQPPVREVIIGLQFDALPALRVVHLAAFLNTLGSDWESLAERTAMGQLQAEPPEGSPWSAALRLDVGVPDLRLRARSAARTAMLQIENGWIVFNWSNWSESRTAASYPGFDSIKAERDALLARWQSFLRERELGTLRPNLWEVTYDNVFPRGELWQEIGDWTEILPGLLGRARATHAGELETSAARWGYRIPGNRGRLTVIAEHGRTSGANPVDVLSLKLVTRGPVRDGSMAEAEDGVRLGHEAIVRTFTEITSPKAQAFWRRQE